MLICCMRWARWNGIFVHAQLVVLYEVGSKSGVMVVDLIFCGIAGLVLRLL